MYFAASVETRYDDALALPRFTAGLVSAFSTLALALAGVGIFGVTAFAVSQRTREFGIRLALGAQRTHVGSIVLRRVGVLAVLGIADWIGARLRPRQLMSGLLFGVSPDDPAIVLGGARHDRVDRAGRDRRRRCIRRCGSIRQSS